MRTINKTKILNIEKNNSKGQNMKIIKYINSKNIEVLFEDGTVVTTYSPKTCCLVNNRINTLIVKCDSKRGEFPLGVSYAKDKGLYKATVNINGKGLHIGFYPTPELAFQDYKEAKEKYIKEVAWIEYIKGNITEDCCRALMNYVVETTD